MTRRHGIAIASIVTATGVVGLCMLVAPVAAHPAGWLLPAAAAAGVAVAFLTGTIARTAYRHHRLSERLRAVARPAIVGEVDVQQLPGAAGAFVAGLRRPQIFCSPELGGLLQPDELQAVLLHERYHQLDRAPAKLVVLEAVAPVMSMARAGRAWLARRIAALEISADRHAIEHGSSRGALARALIKLGPTQAGEFGIGFASAAELRLTALIDAEPMQRAEVGIGWTAAPVLVALFCVLLVVGA